MLSPLINTAKQDTVHLDAIRLDGGTQPRGGINDDYVTELVEALQAGVTLPPVDIMYDGQSYWLFDGFHRHAAHRQANYLVVPAIIHQGTQEEAQWRSYAANQTHGLRRSQADKERAIRAALKHPSAVGQADAAIARHLGVSDKTVTKYRDVETCRQVYIPSLITDDLDLRQSILLLNNGGSESKERTMDVQYTIGVKHDGKWGPKSMAAANAYLDGAVVDLRHMFDDTQEPVFLGLVHQNEAGAAAVARQRSSDSRSIDADRRRYCRRRCIAGTVGPNTCPPDIGPREPIQWRAARRRPR